MSGAEDGPGPVDEFDQIERLFRPLTGDAPEALRLLDDAAVLKCRPGMELVVTKDALVEGVHFLPDDPLDLVARKLLRVNLSDIAAMAAEPFAYFLAVAWPARCGWPERTQFAEGLRHDQDAFGVALLGGDTVSTPGPLTASLTLLGWAPEGQSVKRSGARPGDQVLVSGAIGDGFLGLKAAQGQLEGLGRDAREAMIRRYRLPEPRLALAPALRADARSAADVSDGLVADAGRIALASGVGMVLDLEHMPISAAARLWLRGQAREAEALTALATGGDDYEIVCTAPPEAAERLMAAAQACAAPLTRVGEVVEGEGVAVTLRGRPVEVDVAGWRHR